MIIRTTKENSNFKIGGGVSASLDLGIFKIGAHAEPDYSTSTEEFHKTFGQFSTKAASKTDRKFDMHIDVKSETTESTRSTRRIRNLNQCQTVTYHYFQIARRYKNTLTVVDVRYDISPLAVRAAAPENPLYTTQLNSTVVDYQVQPPRPTDILKPGAGGPSALVTALGSGVRSTAAPQSDPFAATLVHPIVGIDFARPAQELTVDQLMDKLQLDDAARKAFLDELQPMLDRLGLNPGNIVATSEFPINTTGTYADATTGICAACDTHVVEMQELEKKKLELEIQRLKLSLMQSYSILGYVRSNQGGVKDATVSILGVGEEDDNKIIAQEITDDFGFYGIADGSLLQEKRSYKARVTKIPPPFTIATEPPQFDWKGKQIRIDFTLS